MRDRPYQDEINAVQTMNDEELLEFSVFRILDSEEVWGLKKGKFWDTRSFNNRVTVPIWPFKYFAESSNLIVTHQQISSESLEFFVFESLPRLIGLEEVIEIMPTYDNPGCLIRAQAFYDMLSEMMESG